MTANVKAALRRFGREIPVYTQQVASQDEFGQATKEWQFERDVFAARSYQNRNTTMNNTSGELNRDRPVFFFDPDDYPPSGARVKYEGNWYELDAPTPHRSHAVALGKQVVADFDP